MSHPINTINAEDEKIAQEGAYSHTYHYDDLFDIELDIEQIVRDILNGTIKVLGWENPVDAAEYYIDDVDCRWVGEDTTKCRRLIDLERDINIALNGPY